MILVKQSARLSRHEQYQAKSELGAPVLLRGLMFHWKGGVDDPYRHSRCNEHKEVFANRVNQAKSRWGFMIGLW